MPLPDLIEILPLSRPVEAVITVPGSKSITNRALVLAALADGETELRGALWSEDTQVMVESLRELGFMVNVEPDPQEPSNRTITVYGKGGRIPAGGTPRQPLELFVGNAGTAARFLSAMVCLGRGVYRLDGVPRMRERPQSALFGALRELGYKIESANNDRLPALIWGAGPRPGKCQVSIQESSQFASALLLCAKAGGWQVTIAGESSEESSYVAMTSRLIEVFPLSGGVFQIEPDASSGSYFWGASKLTDSGARLSVARWPVSGWQVDAKFPELLQRMFSGEPPQEISRARDLGDSIMTAVVMAPFCRKPLRFVELGRLRLQECDRVSALSAELTRCGARVLEEQDTLTVHPGTLRGAEIETYNDHRMAMCFAMLALKVAGMRIKNPACVNKTFPDFFQKLAAPAPEGLGAAILDARQNRKLIREELSAV
jgi:3-phosphoshikimate 1-carboxyvinyltransferase